MAQRDYSKEVALRGDCRFCCSGKIDTEVASLGQGCLNQLSLGLAKKYPIPALVRIS